MESALSFLGKKALLPVCSLPLLAALTPENFRVRLIDENVEPIDFDDCAKAQIVGLTGMFVQRDRMREILVELKRRGLFTVIGGSWITVREDDFGNLADVIFVGEADETWPRFLGEWLEGRHAARYEQTRRTNLTSLPTPQLDLLPMKEYRFGSIQMSRGCPFTCDFCDIIVVFGRKPRFKAPAQIITELDALLSAGKDTIFVIDDNPIGDKKACKAILREIIIWQRERFYPMSLLTEASIDLAEDDELLQLMVEANVAAVFVGIETPNEESLRETKKIQNLRDSKGSALDKVHRIQKAGIEVWSGMMVGFDNDDDTIFERQRQFIHDANIADTMINMLVAIPKTPLYARLEKEGRIDNSEEAFLLGTNVIPKQMSRDTLRSGWAKLMQDLYSVDAYFARLNKLYLEDQLVPSLGRRRFLQRHPLRSIAINLRLIGEAIAIYYHLMRHIPVAQLRKEYRQRIWQAARRRPDPAVVQLYATKCALHYHSFVMANQMAILCSGVEERFKYARIEQAIP